MDPVKIGLVGYGFGGRYFHAPLIAAAPECEFVGVVTTSAERRGADRAGAPGTARRRLAGGARRRRRRGGQHLDAGRHALRPHRRGDRAWGCRWCATSRSRSTPTRPRVRSTWRERPAWSLSPYQNRRWDSDFLTVRALVADGSLGDVRRFESRFERFAPEVGPGAAGGGTLLDFGSHLVDQALVLLGPVESGLRGAHAARDRTRRRRLRRPAPTRAAPGPTSGAAGSSTHPGRGSGSRGTAGSMVVTTGGHPGGRAHRRRPPARRARRGARRPTSDLDRLFTPAGSAAVRLERRRVGHLLPDVRPRGPRAGTGARSTGRTRWPPPWCSTPLGSVPTPGGPSRIAARPDGARR